MLGRTKILLNTALKQTNCTAPECSFLLLLGKEVRMCWSAGASFRKLSSFTVFLFTTSHYHFFDAQDDGSACLRTQKTT